MKDADEQPDRGPGNPARLVRQVLDLRDTDDHSARSSSCRLACYLLDAANVLPRTAIGAARQIAPWVTYSIAAVQRRIAAHHRFRIHAEKVARDDRGTPPGMRRY